MRLFKALPIDLSVCEASVHIRSRVNLCFLILSAIVSPSIACEILRTGLLVDKDVIEVDLAVHVCIC